MMIAFSHLQIEGSLQSEWDFLLRPSADLEIRTTDQLIFNELGMCVVEFAVQLMDWLDVVDRSGPQFSYTSLESDVDGLVRFVPTESGVWLVVGINQETRLRCSSSPGIEFAELQSAVLAFVKQLRLALLPTFDVLNLISDDYHREAIRVQLRGM